MIDYADARQKMVDSQIRTNDVNDQRLLQAFLDIPRENFVLAERRDLAYLDRDLAIRPDGRFIVKPLVLAKLIHTAEIGASDRVLVVGSASGYGAAVVATLANSVVALDVDPDLSGRAETEFRNLHLANITSATGPLEAGWPAGGPYDVILIEGAVEVVPPALLAQLKPEGRLVGVVRQTAAAKGTIYRALGGQFTAQALFDAQAPLLPGFRKPREFVF